MQRFRGNPAKMRAANIRAERVTRRQKPGTRRLFVVDPLTRRLIRPLLIACMSAALASSILVIASIGTPENRWYWLVPFLFGVTLAAAYSAAWLSNSKSRAVDRTLYRVAEVVVIVAFARLVSWGLFTGIMPTLDELRLYLQAPLEFFLAGGFLTAALAALVGWWFSSSITTLFCNLDVSEEELRYYTLAASSQKAIADDQPIRIPRQDLQDSYMRYFLGGGIVLVLIAALSTFEVRELSTVSNPLAVSRLGLQPAMLVIMLVYFLIGIWQLSHARLLRLNAQWLMDGVAMDSGFERSWQRTSLFWIAIIATVAAFLPIGDTLPISRLLGWLVNGLFYLANMIIALLSYLFASLLASLQRPLGDQPPTQLPQYIPPTFTPPIEPAAPNPIAGIILSSAFWALIVAVVIGAAVFVARERGYNLGWDKLRKGLTQSRTWLRGAWATLLNRFHLVRRSIPNRLRSLRMDPDSTPPTVGERWRYIRLNGLSPREQILYFYLSTVKRASEQGVPRAVGETPREYADDLKQHWPETENEVEDLTSAFITARYSPADVLPEDASTLKARWKQLRDRLRRPVHKPDQPGSP